MQDLKSLIYHTNNFDEHCITKVAPLLRKKLPLHLDELRLINLNITGKISQELVQELRIKNQLSKLALVHVNLTDEAFDILIEVVSKSRNLKELDISWCERNYEDFIPFFEMLSGNRKLSYLNLSCNSLFDHRKGDDGQLTKDTEDALLNLVTFMKKNPYLQHLDLTQANLSDLIIQKIASNLRKC